jgi:hypothetical protein
MKRKFGRWTPRYVVNRINLWQYVKRHPAAPWLTSRAIEFLSQWLRPTDVGFEWGSGRITLWFTKRIKHLTSIEHDSAWYEIVQSRLKLQQLDNLQHRLLAWQTIYAHINGWRALWTSNGISDTGIFWCPAHDEGLSGKKR